jgi:MFS family permease
MRPENYGTAATGRAPGERMRNATLLSISALTVMSGAPIAASLPGIEVHFADIDNVALLSRLVLTLPAVFIAFFSPAAGFLIDRFGRKPLLLVSLILFIVAGSSGLFLDTLPGLLIGRAILGVAVGGIMTATTALVGDLFLGPARDRYMGLQQAFVGIGGTIFLTGGGLLAEVHWRGPFLVYALALLLVPAAALFLPDAHAAKRAGPAPESAPLGRRKVLLLSLLLSGATFNMIVFYMIPTQLPFYLKSLGIEAPSLAGAAIGGGQFVGVLSALAFAPFRRFLGVMGVFALAFFAMGLSYILLSTAGNYAGVLVAMAIAGICMGTVMPNFASAALLLAPPALRGRISGMLVSSIFAGQFLSPLVSQPLIAANGYAWTYGITGLVVLVPATIALAVRLRQSRAGSDQA